MPQPTDDGDDPAMTRAEYQALVSDAAVYDAVVVLWRTRQGTQPVLMPRSIGRRRARRLTAPPRVRSIRPPRRGPRRLA